MNKLNTLITGGAGLIGSHIVDLLLQKGHHVRIIDNLAKPTHLLGKPDWIPAEAEFFQGDVRNKDDLDRALEGIDWVFHQAADGGFTSAISHYFTNNSLPTAILYELMRDKHPIKKVIVASSQAVLGEGRYRCEKHGVFAPKPRSIEQLSKRDWDHHCPICGSPMKGHPNDETQVDPFLPYAMSKYWNEMLALNLGKLYKIPTVALRYSLTYGPRQSLFNPYTGICSIFSTRILTGKPPIVYEDGFQTRDFMFVKDVAKANLLVAEKEEASYKVFNVGTGIATTVLEFINCLAKVYGRKVNPELRGEFRPGDVRHLTTDASHLIALGWKPEVSLEEGLRLYADWIQSYSTIEEYFTEAEKLLKNTNVVMKSA
jgi:dTDP-L-rhamnose 4-epimerase